MPGGGWYLRPIGHEFKITTMTNRKHTQTITNMTHTWTFKGVFNGDPSVGASIGDPFEGAGMTRGKTRHRAGASVGMASRLAKIV